MGRDKESLRPVVGAPDVDDPYRLLVDSISTYAIFSIDPTGKVETWNKGAERLTGYNPSEIIGKHFSTFYADEDMEDGRPELELSVATATGHFEDEAWRVRKDGSRFWAGVGLSSLRGSDGRLRGFGIITRDLTEFKRGEDALRASEERFRLLIDSVMDYAILMLDPEGHVMSWNRGAQRLKGYRTDEVIGQHFSRFYLEEDIKARKPQRELEIAEREGRVEDEGWRVRRDGSKFWANIVITALRGEDGELQGFGKVTRDVTERKRAEDALRGIVHRERETAQRLRDLDQMKNEFVAIVAHDLRSPISVIVGFAETLLSRADDFDDKQRRQALEMIARSAHSLSALIDDVLEVSRIESGEIKFHLVETDVEEVVNRAVAAVASPGRRELVSVNLSDDLPRVMMDEAKVWQVITNLVANAIKFSDADAPIDVDVRRDDEFLMVSVRDRGWGISPEDLPKLFQRFSRLNSPGREVHGTGLGLYICRRLVEAQGGRIWAESNPEEGSTFTFTLPVAARGGN